MFELDKSKGTEQTATELSAGVKAVTFPSGLYLFSVKNAAPVLVPSAGNLPFPALHICRGPGLEASAVEIAGSSWSNGSWLFNPGDTLVVKVGRSGATLILSSIRAEGTQPLEVKVDRLKGMMATATMSTSPVLPRQQSIGTELLADSEVTIRAAIHLKGQGDVEFHGAEWMGHVGSKTWIESVTILALDPLTPNDIEYKGLSANGFETPWVSNGAICGTKGMGMPLIGFAIRLKPAMAAIYDCEYSGSFVSGGKAGPLRNGIPCRSKSATDPLEAIRLRIIKRAGVAQQAGVISVPVAVPASLTVAKAPSFGKFREDESPARSATVFTDVDAAAPARTKKKQISAIEAGKRKAVATDANGAKAAPESLGSQPSKSKPAITKGRTKSSTAVKKKVK